MWRPARPDEDAALIALCGALYAEDPSPAPVPPAQVAATLAALRAAPWRGRALALELGAGPVGYALLIAFWSNELGGEVCVIDELYVAPAQRSQGWGSALLTALQGEPGALWPERPAALALEVTPGNHAAQALYARLGFAGKNLAWRRPLRAPVDPDV
jgi:ribosomal protein S18 acetylase RimI-like enzyme